MARVRGQPPGAARRPLSRERPQEVVRRGYDAAADRYAEWIKGIRDSPRLEWTDDLLARLPERGGDVLELGVGGGVRSTRLLAERHRLVGVDLSEAQLARARERLPGAELIHADMTEVEFADASFDAVVALYTLTHLPREEVPALLARVGRWLRPGGWLLATFGASDDPGAVADDWIGTPMWFSGHLPAQNVEHVRGAGLEVVREQVAEQQEPGRTRPARFHWVLARRPQ